MKEEGKNLAVVIVNWNKKDLLKTCLESLRAQSCKNFQTIVVDNGSTDGSAAFLQENYPEVEIIELKENTGFASGNNVGIRKAFEDGDIEYIITLNNDTKLEPDYIEKILECAKRHPKAGSIQPKVLNFFENGKIDSSGLLISPDAGAVDRGAGKDNEKFQAEEEIFGPSASAALYRREALEKSALAEGTFFDPDYFLYYEDVDLAWRLRLSGFSSWFCPEARVFHIHGASAKKFSAFQKFYIHRNHWYNIFKNIPAQLLPKVLFFMIARYFLIASSIFQKKGSSAKTVENEKGGSVAKIVPKVWLEVGKNFGNILKKRKIIQRKKQVSKKEIVSWFQKYGISLKKSVYEE